MNKLTVRFARRLSFALLAVAVLWTTGCGKGPKGSIKGKVLVGDKPVAGSLIFVGEDGKEITGTIDPTNGSYTVAIPKKGTYKIAVKGTLGATGGLGMPDTKDAKPPGPAVKDMDMKATGAGVPPHAGYEKVETSGLSVDATGEKDQEFNITLNDKGPSK